MEMGQLNSHTSGGVLASSIVRRLRGAGHEAMLVGGCVRDLLLGCKPDDYDVATDATPEQVAALFERTLLAGAKFGVVLVVADGTHVEVATFRRESGYSDRRHPDQVEFSDAEHDAQRRDFTVNALFMDPETGHIVDHVNGQGDIARRLIRCVGDPRARFAEDALRMLRALRFASSLDFEIEPDTFGRLREGRKLILEVSAERVRDELVKGFTRAHRERFLQLLDDSRLLEVILPEVAALKGCDQPPEFHPEGDVFIHTKLMLPLLPLDASATLVFSALLHDIGKPPTREMADRIRFNNHHKVGAEMADAICRRLAFPNSFRERVTHNVLRHMDFMNLTRMKESTLRRFLASPAIEEEIALHRADCLGSHGNTENAIFAERKLADIRAEQPLGALPPPLVNGYDVIALGLKPGPKFKELLRAVQDAQLEGAVKNRDEALDLLRKLST